MLPSLSIDRPMTNYFKLHKPNLPFNADILRMFDGQLISILPIIDKTMVFGGSFNTLDEIGYVFIGYPQITSVEQFKDSGLTFSNLLSHDPINYYIGTIQLKESIVHDLKRVTEQLERQNADLETMVARRTKELLHSEKMASLGTLAAGVAHEINNPMGYILSNLQILKEYHQQIELILNQLLLLKNEARLPEELINFDWRELEYINQDLQPLINASIDGGIKVSNIVTGLKGFAHPSDRTKEPTNLYEIIQAAVNITHNEIKHRSELELACDNDLLINANSSELTQVFVNLLINASQAIIKDGKIKITSETVDDYVIIGVSDNGVGIPQDTLNHLFEPFFTTKKVGQGTGLGLSISLGIIENHKGSITVESTEGVGTSFFIKLPKLT